MDPDRISNTADWFRFYAQKYANLVVRPEDGALLVLGPTAMDRESPIKTFPIPKGVDALSAVLDPAQVAAASAILAAGTAARQEATATADEAFRATEKQMLEAVSVWRTGTNAAERAIAALEVGRLQAELQTLDRARQDARYPHRYIQSADLPRLVINYDPRDERLIPHPVFQTVARTTVVAERIIAADTA